MSNERRSSATRTSPPIHLLRETRYLSRDEILRELRVQPVTGSHPAARPKGTPPRTAASD